MSKDQVLEIVAYAVYGAMALAALYGVFCIVLLYRNIKRRDFSRSRALEFLDVVGDELGKKNFDGVAELCDSPGYYNKAVPQLMLVALKERDRPLNKLRLVIAEKFERDVLSDFENRQSWINTIVKSAPMLGLFGTVLGMINAFAKIAGSGATGTDPTKLANDISFALVTTALGLAIAIPLVTAGNWLSVKISKMQDHVQEDMSTFLDQLTDATGVTSRKGRS